MGGIEREDPMARESIGIDAAAWRAMTDPPGRRRHARRERSRLAEVWRTVGKCRIFARAAIAAARPDRPPAVLVHGLGVSGSYFLPTAERLAPEFDVYVPDLPGHGRSDTPDEPMDVPRLADALVAWMDSVGIGRAALVGNSMGCQVIVEAAWRRPERVDRLVLIGPSGDPLHGSAIRHIGGLVLGIPFEKPSLIGVVLADYLRVGVRLAAEFRSMLESRIEDKLAALAAPMMLVRGEHDPICPRRWLDRAAGLVRAGRVAVIPWWGHAVNYSAPDALVDAIAPFLRARGEEVGALKAPGGQVTGADERRGPPGDSDRVGDRTSRPPPTS